MSSNPAENRRVLLENREREALEALSLTEAYQGEGTMYQAVVMMQLVVILLRPGSRSRWGQVVRRGLEHLGGKGGAVPQQRRSQQRASLVGERGGTAPVCCN